MAEAVSFLTSARASLGNLPTEPFEDPQVGRIVASVSIKVSEAVSTLDELSVTQWLNSESAPGLRYSHGGLPTWWACLDE
jgi:hypothetical protein